jgi:DNA-binding response OmpR family regulator
VQSLLGRITAFYTQHTMALIVVCEDDSSTRTLITAVLKKAGHVVEAFDNGLKGYARLLEGDVELLISDVQMPGKNGFALVSQVRPCILLTSLQERAHMRIGMTSGADDYVTKPFQPSELLEAVDSQLKRAMQLHISHLDETLRSVDTAVGRRTNELMDLYEKRLQRELQSRWSRADVGSSELSGSLVSCMIAHQDAWLQVLSGTQMADLARHFFNKVSDCAALFNAEHLQFIGEGLLIVFDEKVDTPSVHHASRARRLVESMDTIAASMRSYIAEHLSVAASKDQPLPRFRFAMAVHEGRLSLGKLDGLAGSIEQLVPVGQDVQFLARLLKAGQSLGWPVLLSAQALDHWKSKGLPLEVADQRFAKNGQDDLAIYRLA